MQLCALCAAASSLHNTDTDSTRCPCSTAPHWPCWRPGLMTCPRQHRPQMCKGADSWHTSVWRKFIKFNLHRHRVSLAGCLPCATAGAFVRVVICAGVSVHFAVITSNSECYHYVITVRLRWCSVRYLKKETFFEELSTICPQSWLTRICWSVPWNLTISLVALLFELNSIGFQVSQIPLRAYKYAGKHVCTSSATNGGGGVLWVVQSRTPVRSTTSSWLYSEP